MEKNKIPTMLLALLIAIGLWSYVMLVVDPESYSPYTVPVNFQGEDTLKERGLMLAPGTNQQITVRVQGNRSDLNRLSAANVVATVDLSNIREADTYNLNIRVSVGDNNSSSFLVVDKQPSSMAVTILDYQEKDVPVRLNCVGQLPADNLILDQEGAVLSTKNVHISGPSSVVEQIRYADLLVPVEGLTSTLDQTFRPTLVNAAGEPVDASHVTVDVAEVHVRLTVEHMKEVPLVVELKYGGGTSENSTSVSVNPKTITISGSEETLENINSILLGTIDLAEQSGSTTMTLPIKVPSTVTNRSGLEEAEVTLEFRDLRSRTFYVSDFKAVNVPAGYQVEIQTKQLTVTVRGPGENVSALSAGDVQVSVDCGSVTPGTVTVPVTVSVSDLEVGVVGQYNVLLTLTALPDADPDGSG